LFTLAPRRFQRLLVQVRTLLAERQWIHIKVAVDPVR
jgi:hypothetical protein